MGKKIKQEPHIKLEHTEKQKPTKLQAIGNNTEIKQQKQINKKAEEKPIDKEPGQQKKKSIKHARLIIRNLVFDINEKHIRKLMAPFGQVKQVNIPTHPDKKISKGFAFVEMANKNECLRAIKKLNGTNFKGRTIVLDMAVSKQNFMTEKLNQNQSNEKNNDIKMQDEKQQKNQGNEEMQNQENEEQANKKEQDHQDNDEDQENEGQNQQDEEESQEDEQQQQKLMKQKQDHLHQVFIRNLPISTTEKDLYKHFIKYGQISFAKIVKNKQTGISKGTAFIKFKDPDVAQKLIEYSRTYQMFLLKKIKNFTQDPNIKLEIDGAIMKIFPVQSRQQISDKLKQREGDDKPKKTKPIKKIKKLQDLVKTDIHGKRKLALALIGRWKAEQNMNKYDYEMFKNHEKEKIQKLKNPNESISSTRVILKHLDKAITEDQLRAFCLDFLQQVQLNKTHLTYSKLMLEKDMKKSAGFAFVEFKKHETAKQFIEKLVQNPKVLQKQLFIVEFAIQDSRKMLKLKKKNQPHTKPSIKKPEDNKTNKHKKIKKDKFNKQIKKRSFKK